MSKKISFDPSFPTKRDYFKAWADSLLIDHAIFRLLWTNFDTIIPGKVYRSNHPTPARIKKLVDNYKIKTIFNLRGKRDCGSDALSRYTCQKLGIIHNDIPFESRGAPNKERIFNLIKLYKKSEFPLLIHCKSGADRAGLVAAIIIQLEQNNIQLAKQQLSYKYGHFKYSKTGILDSFFDQYYNQTLSKKNFFDWVEEDYNEQKLKNDFKSDFFSSLLNDILLKRE